MAEDGAPGRLRGIASRSEGLREALVPHWRGGASCQVLEGGRIALGDPVRWEGS